MSLTEHHVPLTVPSLMSVSFTPVPGGYLVRFPYDEGVVAQMRLLPKGTRRWDPVARAWFVSTSSATWAIRIMEAKWPGSTAPPPPVDPEPARDDPHAVLHLLPSAPPAVVKAAHRALALLLHPDRGGDTHLMQRVNAAYDRIQHGK